MENDLTGNFDVVAEFSTGGANRVLAAMHRSERFLHSVTARVDDNPPPGSLVRPTIVGSKDEFGDATVNHTLIGTPVPVAGELAASNPVYRLLDTVVNPGLLVAGLPPVIPSHLQGAAQLQLSPPTIEVSDASGTNLTVSLQVMTRYFPDPHTPPVAEFVRGELRITGPLDQIAKADVNAVKIDITGDKVNINFTPTWPKDPPLSDDDVAGINQLIRNALRTSFLPSSNPVPPSMDYLRFKTVLGAQNAIGFMLNMARFDPVTGQHLPPGNPGDPATVNTNFLGPGDDFAFAVGIDYVRAVLKPTIDNMLSQSYSVTIPVPLLFTTAHVTYTITLNSGAVDLQDSKIVLTIQGQAVQTSHKWYAPDNFNFTAQLAFTLQVDGATADLVPGDVSLNTSSWLANLFSGSATDSMKQVRDQALSQKDASGKDAYAKVNDMFSADENLGGFLKSLLNPADQTPGGQPREELKPELAYTPPVKIRSSGIVLHGSLAVPDWPPAHVEFEQIPATGGGRRVVGIAHPILRGPDYSALLSWIPGGRIQKYEWSSQGQPPFIIDDHKFVLLSGPPHAIAAGAVPRVIPPEVSPGVFSTGAVSGFVPICLTVTGKRIASSGPTVDETVSATHCGYTRVSVVSGLVSALGGALPMVALTRPGPGGLVDVTGHASAAPPDGGNGGTPNVMAHFANERTAAHLEFLTQALRESKREDAPTAVLAVLTPYLLAKARYTEGVIYAEEQGGAWERAFGAKTARPPLTLIVGPKGNIVWQQEGELEAATLAAALQRFLVKSGPVRLGLLRLNVKIGWPAPNIVFNYAPGGELTLRKLANARLPAVAIFWNSASKQSIETVRNLQTATAKAGGQRPVVLAINAGEAQEVAERVAAENAFSAIVVPDPQREISSAYGVSIYPTALFIDASGVVRNIRYGRLSGEQGEYSSGAETAAAKGARYMTGGPSKEAEKG